MLGGCIKGFILPSVSSNITVTCRAIFQRNITDLKDSAYFISLLMLPGTQSISNIFCFHIQLVGQVCNGWLLGCGWFVTDSEVCF